MVVVLLATIAALGVCQPSQGPENLEAKVMSEMLVTFSQLVEWPPANGATHLTVCVLGHDPLGQDLDSVTRGRTVSGRPIQVLRPQGLGTLSCDVAFLAKEENAKLTGLLRQLRKKNVLTVSNAPSFLESGGLIRLFLDEGKLRFEINPEAAKRGEVKLSSKLMKLASIRRVNLVD